MSEITAATYCEKMVDEMVEIYTERYLGAMNLWVVNQGLKAARLDGVESC